MNEITAKVQALTESFQEMRQKMFDELKPEFENMFQAYLEKYPFVNSVFFTAYTPYFNDGEECTYSVHDLEIAFGAEDDEGSMAGFSGPGGEDFIAYRVDGTVTETMKRHTDYYTQPRKGYAGGYGRYGYSSPDLPPIHASLEECLQAHYPAQMKMSYAELKSMDQAEADFDKLAESFSSIDEDFIKGMFGDHVKVIATRNGIETEVYDHD